MEAIAKLPGLSRRLLVYAQSSRQTTASGIEVLGFDAVMELLQHERI